jgi:hypothetical protein
MNDVIYARMKADAQRPTPRPHSMREADLWGRPVGRPRRPINPARPTPTPTSTLRISLFPEPPPARLARLLPLRLHTEGSKLRVFTASRVTQADGRLGAQVCGTPTWPDRIGRAAMSAVVGQGHELPGPTAPGVQ